jgi:hypothetical protein
VFPSFADDIVAPDANEVFDVFRRDLPVGPRNVVVWSPGNGAGALATGFGLRAGCLTVT